MAPEMTREELRQQKQAIADAAEREADLKRQLAATRYACWWSENQALSKGKTTCRVCAGHFRCWVAARDMICYRLMLARGRSAPPLPDFDKAMLRATRERELQPPTKIVMHPTPEEAASDELAYESEVHKRAQ